MEYELLALRKPHKFDSDEKVEINFNIEIPLTEYNILDNYSRGATRTMLCMGAGCDYKTIDSILRRNIKKMLGKC